MKILPVLLIFFVLEVLSALMWFSGALCMAIVSFFLLGGESQDSLMPIWPLFGIWAVLFALPGILQMIQVGIWTRGLTTTMEDVKKWSKSSSTGLSEPETVATE